MWKPRRQRRWIHNNAAPGLTQTPPSAATATPQKSPPAGFPPPQGAPPAFMPYMPSYEAGLRGLEDQYAQQRMGILNQLNLIQPQYNLQSARMNTDKGYANQQLDENLVGRGMFDSGSNAYLRNRDIDVPYGRQAQDLSQWAGSQAASLQAALGQTDLGYYQGMAELLLNNASDAASNMPMNVPQFSQGYTGKPPRRNKPRNKPGRK